MSDRIELTEREAKFVQALSTAVWHLREIAKDSNDRYIRIKASTVAADAHKVVEAALNGNDLPEWLSPLFKQEGE